MNNTAARLPRTDRRPTGLTPKIEAALLKNAAEITADGVRAVLEDNPEHAEHDAASAWMRARPSVKPDWLWWVLERRDVELRLAQELGLDEEEEDEAEEAQEEPVQRTVSSDLRESLRGRYVYGAFRNEVFDRRARDWIGTQAMDNLEAHRMPRDDRGRPISAFAVLRTDMDAARVHNERYTPGRAEEIVENDGVAWLNTWQPPTVRPVKGTAKPLLDHILYLCNGNKEQAGHITDWLAYMVQNPGAKINHALLIISKQGRGKDTLAAALARVIGETNVKFISDDDVSEGRYDFMKRAQLVVVPETRTGDRKDLANKLKPLITQPLIRVNEKNVKPYDVVNTVNMMMFSNHEDAAHIEDADRRYFVVICRADAKDPAYYTDLYRYIEGDEIAGFAWFLKNRDLSNFNPKAPAPWTQDKETVREAARGGVEAWLEDAWQSYSEPFNREVVNLRHALSLIAETRGAPKMTIQQIASFLKKDRIGGGDLGPRRVNGKMERLFAVRHFGEVSKMGSAGLAALMKTTNIEEARAIDARASISVVR